MFWGEQPSSQLRGNMSALPPYSTYRTDSKVSRRRRSRRGPSLWWYMLLLCCCCLQVQRNVQLCSIVFENFIHMINRTTTTREKEFLAAWTIPTALITVPMRCDPTELEFNFASQILIQLDPNIRLTLYHGTKHYFF